ncbi:YraN family protein [Magnetospirillum sp. UT-4]|uniref:YraN family protein n=1 Tax=Magnetospirillum sp. UT-4 TaxID=2681467 RepID=UPI00137DB953|nr:YraN family protein [Magnetospirillum sp. UT-4]CAA7616302.1 conserved hypothetical protein [Magnetospirillum sp. UT-4]
MSASAARQRALRRGRTGEALAAWWLRLKGYSVLARGHATGRGTGAGEIDLVVRRGGVLAFVEVKARAAMTDALHAVTANQRRRIARAAEAFLARRPDLTACTMRFDTVMVAPWRLPRHIPNAWRMDA